MTNQFHINIPGDELLHRENDCEEYSKTLNVTRHFPIKNKRLTHIDWVITSVNNIDNNIVISY